MKNTLIYIYICVFIISPINIFAINYEQSYEDGIIVVLIDDSNNKPINTNTILTNNPILNSILDDFNTEKFYQLFPHSKNDTLLTGFKLVPYYHSGIKIFVDERYNPPVLYFS